MKDLFDNIFVNEDISKPENRINLAIFHLQMDSDFHNWFLHKLGLNSCVIYPIKNVDGSRPDFVIKNLQGELIGYVEVECGVDVEQLNRFKRLYEKNGVRVYSVYGKREYHPDLSLEEIKEYLESRLDKIQNNQVRLSSKYLIESINSTIYRISDTKRKPVSEEFINSNPFISELLLKLTDIDKPKDINRPNTGHIYYDTVKEKGFSLRVFSKKTRQGIALFSISGGKPQVRFQSEEKYRHYLQHKNQEDVDEWINFITNSLNIPIDSLRSNQSLEIPISIVNENLDELEKIIRKLV